MRNLYNLSHLAHLSGHIGRLQTISVIPVVPGDSLDININGIFRLAPFRKEIVAECQIDICAFYVPHRHVWPTEWPEIVRSGLQSLTNLTNGPAVAATDRDPFFLGIKECGATVNRALIYGYNEIYRRYFAVPTTSTNGAFSFLNNQYYPAGSASEEVNSRKYGYRAARLPHILNGAIMVNQAANAGGSFRAYTDDDWGVPVAQDTPAPGVDQLDIRDLKSIQSRYKSVQEQNYFATFYNDVIEQKWNTKGVNTDADPRPTYLGRATHFVSGADVNGTDDATLGSYVGKTLDRISFQLPRRFMPEHGNVWLMMLPRFPLVHTKEQHPLLATPSNTISQKLLLADPTVWAGEQVVPFDPAQWIAGGSLWTPDVDLMQQPYGQEYRYQPNRIHPVFETIPGYPFTSWDTANANDWYYYTNNEYTDTFQTSQIGHWQTHAQVNVKKYSSIVDPRSSIFAGA